MSISQAFSCLVHLIEMMAICPILFYFVKKCQYDKKRKKKKTYEELDLKRPIWTAMVMVVISLLSFLVLYMQSNGK